MDVCNPNKHREYTLIFPFSNLGINLYYIINNFYRNIVQRNLKAKGQAIARFYTNVTIKTTNQL